MIKSFFLFILLVFPSLAHAQPPVRSIEGTVINVADGDSITVNAGGEMVKVRLYGIDAPQDDKVNITGRTLRLAQHYGKDATRALNDKVLQKQVRLDVMAVDQKKRSICIVRLGGRDINKELVAEGWGWVYRKFLEEPYLSEYIQAEEQARKLRRGLWQDAKPQPPWEFKRKIMIQDQMAF